MAEVLVGHDVFIFSVVVALTEIQQFSVHHQESMRDSPLGDGGLLDDLTAVLDRHGTRLGADLPVVETQLYKGAMPWPWRAWPPSSSASSSSSPSAQSASASTAASAPRAARRMTSSPSSRRRERARLDGRRRRT